MCYTEHFTHRVMIGKYKYGAWIHGPHILWWATGPMIFGGPASSCIVSRIAGGHSSYHILCVLLLQWYSAKRGRHVSLTSLWLSLSSYPVVAKLSSLFLFKTCLINLDCVRLISVIIVWLSSASLTTALFIFLFVNAILSVSSETTFPLHVLFFNLSDYCSCYAPPFLNPTNMVTVSVLFYKCLMKLVSLNGDTQVLFISV